MNSDEQNTFHLGGEQSWIVLDDNGSVSASRPPTASPSRPTRFNEEDGEEAENRLLKRVGMDRDVREALELAERSLEMAGSADEFMFRRAQISSDDDRSSPGGRILMSNAAMVEDFVEDRYNGRAPPTISGNRRGLVIATDSEHVAFQNIKLVSSSPRPDTPTLPSSGVPQNASSAGKDVGFKSLSTASNRTQPISSNYRLSTIIPESGTDEGSKSEDDEEIEGSFLHWAFGMSGSSSLVPIMFSHVITLLVGFYIGSRRSSAPSSPSTNTAGTQCSTGASGNAA
jgi:hypothetical protein